MNAAKVVRYLSILHRQSNLKCIYCRISPYFTGNQTKNASIAESRHASQVIKLKYIYCRISPCFTGNQTKNASIAESRHASQVIKLKMHLLQNLAMLHR